MPIPISRYHHWLEQEIRRQKYGNAPVSLYEPIRYIMSLGGKRLRPMFTLLSYSLYRDDVKKALPYAVAVESFVSMLPLVSSRTPMLTGWSFENEKWEIFCRFPSS